MAVMDDHNNFIPKIPQGYFRVLEDGVPQQITQFGRSEAPITICMLIEFSGRFQALLERRMARDVEASYGFLQTLKPDDNVAVVTYDLRYHDSFRFFARQTQSGRSDVAACAFPASANRTCSTR